MFDQFNNFHGTVQGIDRKGHTTPSPDLCDTYRPFHPVPYPAPWLPIKRRDEGHPVGAGKVLSEGNLVGTDKSGALIPAGLFCGQQAAKADGGEYCVLVYTDLDRGTVWNPQTAKLVAAAGEHVVLACPSDAAEGDEITLPNGGKVTVSAADIVFAKACTLIPGGKAKSLGYIVRDTFVYIGGVEVTDTTGGMKYVLLTQRPDQFLITNYMHEAGGVYQTRFCLRLPWIGASLTKLQELATEDGVLGYTQTDYSRSFVHFTGDKAARDGAFFLGCAVVASSANNGADAGNFAPYDPTKHAPDDIVGRVLGVELMYPIRDFANRVRTQFERANEFVGPRMDPNPVTFQMGGSATKGMDYAISITTNGLFQTALKQGKPVHDEYATYVLVHVHCR